MASDIKKKKKKHKLVVLAKVEAVHTQKQSKVLEVFFNCGAVFVTKHLIELSVDGIGSIKHNGG